MHCHEIIYIHFLDVVFGNKQKVVSSFYHLYFFQNHAHKIS